jgi:hypothetical protein
LIFRSLIPEFHWLAIVSVPLLPGIDRPDE